MYHSTLIGCDNGLTRKGLKQVNILCQDAGFPLKNVVVFPTTGALGYGIEYGYSVMERLRLAALQGDAMTQFPMIVTPGFEAWKTKEAKASAKASPKAGATGRPRRLTGKR